MRIPRLTVIDREEWILSRCVGKRVLHFGCADWPYTSDKLRSRSLLHQRLQEVSNHLVGLDQSEEGIRLLKAAGFANVHAINAETPSALRTQPDVIVVGEIIEHVDNVGRLLESISVHSGHHTEIIVTTINFVSVKRAWRLLYRNEVVHPDHVYYFSVSTLTELARRQAWDILEWHAFWVDYSRRSAILNSFLRRTGLLAPFADGLAFAASRRWDASPVSATVLDNATRNPDPTRPQETL